MQLIDSLYRQHLPSDFLANASVLDAGGGLGQMSAWFAEQGARVTYFDVSSEMLARAKEFLAAGDCLDKVSLQQSSIFDFSPNEPFEFVNLHAVLEWLENPLVELTRVLSWVKPGGYIGLLVYNKHMLMLRHLMRGTLQRVLEDDLSGDASGLTPISPLEPLAVSNLLVEANFQIITQAGIRSFTDLSESAVLEWYSDEELLKAERLLCEQPPYRDMARYVLFIARKA